MIELFSVILWVMNLDKIDLIPLLPVFYGYALGSTLSKERVTFLHCAPFCPPSPKDPH